MKLSIVIPAYNEEEAIGSTIDRCLAARQFITEHSPVDSVEVIVVSDGSTDQTSEIAGQFDDVRVIVFERNRGYGAAIKAGFQAADGDLLGFLDADGTCDPRFFAVLCRALVDEDASVALGSRMGPDSRMPQVRRLGNRIFAFFLSVLSNRVVTDSASGMRVVRRDILHRLFPLPDGLHFTPAMTTRVVMDESLKLAERPMPYDERVGQSKLKVLKDGVRFLRAIVGTAAAWNPRRVYSLVGSSLGVATVVCAMYPLEVWLRAGQLSGPLWGRLLACVVLSSLAFTFLSLSVLCGHIQGILFRSPRTPTFTRTVVDLIFSRHAVWAFGLIGLTVLVGAAPGAFLKSDTQGRLALHPVWFPMAACLVLVISHMFLGAMVIGLTRFHTGRGQTLTAKPEEAVAKSCSLDFLPVPTTKPSVSGSNEEMALAGEKHSQSIS
jgi:glycosyltransferase involved in cell wall biosynthesis